MARIRGDGNDVPLVFPLSEIGRATVHSHLLHVRFKFVEDSIYVEEERRSEDGVLEQSIPIQKSLSNEGPCWYLGPGDYRAYGLPLHVLAASVEIGSRQSVNSTVNRPFLSNSNTPSPHERVDPMSGRNVSLIEVKVERLESIVELSSGSEGLSPSVNPLENPLATQEDTSMKQPPHSHENFYSLPSRKSTCSNVVVQPSSMKTRSIIQFLLSLSNVLRSRNELSTLDLTKLKHHVVRFLPPEYNGDAIFELPPCSASSSSSAAKNLEGMDKRYDGHAWCKLMTTNIHNSDKLKFRKSFCAGHLVCENPSCEYLLRAAKKNETEWTGTTIMPFRVGEAPPRDCKLVCKLCRVVPVCIETCDARMYYCYSTDPDVSRAAIHLGHHSHPVAKGLYRDSAKDISNLIATEIALKPTATNSSITLSASKEFLTTYLFHRGEGEKKNLEGEEMDEVMDRFQILSSPNIRNMISSFRSNNQGGVIDNIMTMKKESKFEFIHDSVFPGQGKDKVYLFKMLTDGPGSGVDLIRRMQTGGDLQNAWMMFDHVKRVKDWTTMACHVYDSEYKKVMTIAVCDMQSEDTEIQVQFWRSLNNVVRIHGVENPNFKGFMADSAQANWNAVRIVYGSGSPNDVMENRERTCLLHWSNSLQKHTQKYIKQAFQQQHVALCKQYKESKTLDEAEVRYLAIKSWWLSSGAAMEDSLHHLDHWLAFWHFRYLQWGGFMTMGLTLEEMADMPFCNLSETVHNKWLQMSGKRGNNLFDATCDDAIRAWMQMTNFRGYKRGHTSGSGPSKGELKLRAARRSGCPKKLAEALNTLPEAHGIGTRVPHLEGEELFGSQKRGLDVPIGDAGDSHRPDKVNFSQPRVRTRSSRVPEDLVPGGAPCIDVQSSHYVTVAWESDCNTSEWHIARINHKSNARCWAQQRNSKMKCTSRIARGGKGTPAPTYRGRKEEYGTKRAVVVDFWFCWDDIERCVKGTKRKWVIDWPEVPIVWPILLGTNLNREETLLLQHAGFRLQERPILSPKDLFPMSRIFEPVLFTQSSPPNPDAHPTVRNNRTIKRLPNPPTPEQRNKWESAGNIKGEILGVTLVPNPGLGAIVILQTGVEPNKNVYRVTVGTFPSCTCPDFVNMILSAVGGRAQYVNCKHLYYLYRYFCKADINEDKFIHAPSYSFNELKVLLLRAGIIITT